MTWLKLDDMFAWHRKIRRLSDGAFRLHVTAMNMSARDGLDGFITHEDLDDMPSIKSADKRATELVLRGLWVPTPDGWEIHDFLEYNPSRAQVQAQQKATRERKARWDAKRRGEIDPTPDEDDPEDDDERGGNGVTHATGTAGVTVPRPDPTRPDPYYSPEPVGPGVVFQGSRSSSSRPSNARAGR